MNPRPVNRHGHILEITEDRNDQTSETFSWTLPILCGDPAQPDTYFMGFDKAGHLRRRQERLHRGAASR